MVPAQRRQIRQCHEFLRLFAGADVLFLVFFGAADPFSAAAFPAGALFQRGGVPAVFAQNDVDLRDRRIGSAAALLRMERQRSRSITNGKAGSTAGIAGRRISLRPTGWMPPGWSPLPCRTKA